MSPKQSVIYGRLLSSRMEETRCRSMRGNGPRLPFEAICTKARLPQSGENKKERSPML